MKIKKIEVVKSWKDSGNSDPDYLPMFPYLHPGHILPDVFLKIETEDGRAFLVDAKEMEIKG